GIRDFHVTGVQTCALPIFDALPDGRVQWESNSELNQYGTPMSPMLIPYWTEGSHKSMEGLYFESSLTTPFHFINHSEMSYKPSKIGSASGREIAEMSVEAE